MQDHQRMIHLSEISATDFPASNLYKYKCRVKILSNEGQSLLEKDLFARMQPSWLVELKNKGDCTITITFCYREGDISHPWEDAGEVTFKTQEYLNGESNTELEFSLTTWTQAPQLKLKTRLTQSTNESNNNTISLLNNQNGYKRLKPQTNGNIAVELPEAVTLTSSEEVIIKDVWNKLRAWKELQMEKFFKRLLLEEPELEYLFGEALPSMSDFFYELFDRAVHRLQPETQTIVGEPLMGVPPEKEDGFDTVEEYGALLNEQWMC